MTALGLALSLLFVPDIQKKKQSLPAKGPVTLSFVLHMFNPLRIFRPFIYPNVFLCVRRTKRLSIDLMANTSSISHAVYWQHFNTPFSPPLAPSSILASTLQHPS
jgi:hypothetical protein